MSVTTTEAVLCPPDHRVVLIVWKGGSARIHVTDSETIGIIFGVGGAVALLIAVFFLPWLYRILLKNDWELSYWHVLLGPLLLRRGDPPPPPEGYSPVQDYYAGHMTLEELKAHRATMAETKSKDLENNDLPLEKGVGASGDLIHSDSDSGKPVAPKRPTQIAPTGFQVVGPRPEGAVYSPGVLFWYFKRVFFRGLEKDIISLQKKRNILTGDIETVHAHAAHYDNRSEYMYSFLQVLTASAASFTHGANDVSK